MYVCFLFCVFCVFVLFCVLFPLLFIAVSFLFLYKFTHHCKPSGNPFALNKYHIINDTACKKCFFPCLSRFIMKLIPVLLKSTYIPIRYITSHPREMTLTLIQYNINAEYTCKELRRWIQKYIRIILQFTQ